MSWVPSWTQTADGEEGDESDWDAVGEVGTGTLDVSSDAPKNGTYGWAVTINGAANYAYADLTGPAADTVHSLRLQFDPNGITMGSDEAFVLAQGFSDSNDWIWFMDFYRDDSKYHVRVVILDDDGGSHYGNSVELSDAYHQITISWKQSDGSNNGFIRLFVDTDYKDVISGIDNDTHNINIARTGAGYGVDAGTAGTFYLDDVQWCASELIPSAQAGVLAFAGALSNWNITKVLGGILAPSGIIKKFIRKGNIWGTLTPSGVVTKLVRKGKFLGGISPSGAITKKVKKALAGTLSFVGTILNRLGINVDITFYLAPEGTIDLNLTPEGDIEVDLTPEGTVELRRS
jgi:hypothetical protein